MTIKSRSRWKGSEIIEVLGVAKLGDEKLIVWFYVSRPAELFATQYDNWASLDLKRLD